MSNEKQDPMILCKSAREGSTRKGGTYVSVNIAPDEADQLLDAIEESIHEKRGVQLMVTLSERENKSTGEKFKGAVVFVRETPEFKEDESGSEKRRSSTSSAKDRVGRSLRSGRSSRREEG